MNITAEHVSVLAVNPPVGRGYALSAVNDPNGSDGMLSAARGGARGPCGSVPWTRWPGTPEL